MAVGRQLLGHGLLVYAMAAVPATVVSLVLLASPALAAALAWALFGEGLSTAQVIGGVLVLGGLTAAALSPARRRRPAVAAGV